VDAGPPNAGGAPRTGSPRPVGDDQERDVATHGCSRRAIYHKLIYFNKVDKGFAAWEEPELFSKEIRAAFRSLR
jgi:hypothetical protein